MEANVLEQPMTQLADTGQRFDRAAERLDSNQQRLEQCLAETRRHFDAVAERLESNHRLLAAGLGRLDTKLDDFGRGVRQDLRKQVGEIKLMLRLLGAEVAQEETSA